MATKPEHGIELVQKMLVQICIVILYHGQLQRVAPLELVDDCDRKAIAFKALINITTNVTAATD